MSVLQYVLCIKMLDAGYMRLERCLQSEALKWGTLTTTPKQGGGGGHTLDEIIHALEGYVKNSGFTLPLEYLKLFNLPDQRGMRGIESPSWYIRN